MTLWRRTATWWLREVCRRFSGICGTSISSPRCRAVKGWGPLLVGAVLRVCLAVTGAAAYQLEQQQISCPQPSAAHDPDDDGVDAVLRRLRAGEQ